MRKSITLVIIFFLSVTMLDADEATTHFINGNKAYEAGQFEEAVQYYEYVIGLKKENWQLYYNLGNAYFRLGVIGKAILNYERALKLNSENEDIRFNLELAALQTLDRIPEPPKELWLTALEKWLKAPAFSFLLYTTLAIYALILCLLAARNFFAPIARAGLVKPVLVVATIFLFVFGGIFSYRWYDQAHNKYGVIIAEEVSVTSSPASDATELFILHQGTKFQLREQSDNWMRIRLRDGKSGWINAQTAGKI